MSRNKSDAATHIAQELAITKKEATAMIDTLLDFIVASNVNGEKVQFTGFGQFIPHTKAARYGSNIQTGKRELYPQTTIPKFKPAEAYVNDVKAGHK